MRRLKSKRLNAARYRNFVAEGVRLVRSRLHRIPAAMIVMVAPNDTRGGNFSSPSRSATKILEPMKISTTASAGFKYRKRWIIAASAK